MVLEVYRKNQLFTGLFFLILRKKHALSLYCVLELEDWRVTYRTLVLVPPRSADPQQPRALVLTVLLLLSSPRGETKTLYSLLFHSEGVSAKAKN